MVGAHIGHPMNAVMTAVPVDLLTSAKIGRCGVALLTLAAIHRASMVCFASLAQAIDAIVGGRTRYHSADAVAL